MNGLIIILGAPNDAQGNLSSIARERCDHAIEVYRSHPGYKLLLTGGYGAHFNTTVYPHAYYAKKYLRLRNIPEQDILEFVESANTREDAALSKPIIEKYRITRLIVITSDFHLKRAESIFCKAFPHIQISFSGSHTNLPQEQLEMLIQHEQEALQIFS